MPISRPLLIALVAAVVAVIGFYATQGGDEPTDSAAPVIPAVPAPRPVEDDKAVDAPRKASRPVGVPRAVQRAIRADRRVVLFFYKPGSADDRATARGVAALRGDRGVAVFTDPISRLARYRGLIGDLGISQAPAVVIVGRDREARVIEGYVDPASLAQDVADTR
jgi:hypothetical protein